MKIISLVLLLIVIVGCENINFKSDDKKFGECVSKSIYLIPKNLSMSPLGQYIEMGN